jgi:CheY-like chemotaxis protein
MASHTILVVDDDADIRDTLSEVLRNAGMVVVTAANGLEALRILRGGLSPCLVLLDLMMPIMDGYEFLEVQRGDPALALIPTAVITAGFAVDNTRTGDTPLLRKPLGLKGLMAVIGQYC